MGYREIDGKYGLKLGTYTLSSIYVPLTDVQGLPMTFPGCG